MSGSGCIKFTPLVTFYCNVLCLVYSPTITKLPFRLGFLSSDHDIMHERASMHT